MGGRALRAAVAPIGRVIALRSHHSSHRRILSTESTAESRTGRVDAVVVPASRPISCLQNAVDLAAAMDCALVAFCSRQVSAHEVTALAERQHVTTVAVDVQDGIGAEPSLGTSVVLAGSPLERTSDAGDKRNLALQLARVAGWARVLFLDDDIDSVASSDVSACAALLDHYSAVGLDNLGFPDNSVVCHAHRALGGAQAQFIGAGALAVSPTRVRSFFPRIYNQDWLFMIGQAIPPWLAVAGRMKQAAFDPFADPDRARSEEFGDCLAEGLYWLLDRGRRLEHADREHWRDFLMRRRRFLNRLLWLADKTTDHHVPRERLLASLEAARATNTLITPELCAEYVALWRSDLVTWRRHLESLPTEMGLEGAVAELGIGSESR